MRQYLNLTVYTSSVFIQIILASFSVLCSLQAVPTSKGQALADEYGIKFFETVSVLKINSSFYCLPNFYKIKIKLLLQSAKTNLNVEEVFFSIARDIKQRLADTDSKAEVITLVQSYEIASQDSIFVSVRLLIMVKQLTRITQSICSHKIFECLLVHCCSLLH